MRSLIEAGDTATSASRSTTSGVRLKKNTISPLGLAALAIGITSPAMGLFALWGTMEAATGPVTPLIFLSAMLVTLPTGISYAVLNSRFPSAGAASTWLWRSMSPLAGFLAGLMMSTYFLMATMSVPVMFAISRIDPTSASVSSERPASTSCSIEVLCAPTASAP